jgi:flagellar biosynthesis protein FliP
MKLLWAGLILAVSSSQGFAQSLDINALSQPGALASGRIVQLIAILSVLSLAPSLLVMMTSFTRIAVALSFLRSGLGLQSAPANIILVSLALFMTFFTMGPSFDRAWRDGVQPLMSNSISETEAVGKIVDPFREFMAKHVREKDVKMLGSLAHDGDRSDDGKVGLRILIPAFMMSELRRGFEIGFLIALPFLVIDLIVATLTMSMGMMMLPPSVIALPIKVLFFVLIDGWSLLVGSLIRSYQ